MLNDMQKNGAIRWSLPQTPVNRYAQLVTWWSFVHVTLKSRQVSQTEGRCVAKIVIPWIIVTCC